MKRAPTRPGVILSEEFLIPLGITQKRFAAHLKMSTVQLSGLVSGKRGVGPVTALKLAAAFGTTPEFWLNLQMQCDLHAALQRNKTKIRRIK